MIKDCDRLTDRAAYSRFHSGYKMWLANGTAAHKASFAALAAAPRDPNAADRASYNSTLLNDVMHWRLLMHERSADKKDNKRGLATPSAINSRVSLLIRAFTSPISKEVFKVELGKPPNRETLHWLEDNGSESIKDYARKFIDEREVAAAAAITVGSITLSRKRLASGSDMIGGRGTTIDARSAGGGGGVVGGDALQAMMRPPKVIAVSSELHTATESAARTGKVKSRHALKASAQTGRHDAAILKAQPPAVSTMTAISCHASVAFSKLSSAIGLG